MISLLTMIIPASAFARGYESLDRDLVFFPVRRCWGFGFGSGSIVRSIFVCLGIE
jgi:hypothetical protein